MKLLIALFACVALSVNATTYFVDIGTGSDSNSGLNTGSPWAHVPGTVGVSGSGWPASFVNGDKIIVKGGSVNNSAVYLGTTGTGDAPNFYNGSSAFNSIIIQSGDLFTPQWGTTSAIFDGQMTRLYGFAFNQVTGVTIDGFEVRNIADGVASFGQGSAGVEVSSAHWIWIRRCWIHKCGVSVDDRGHGIEGGQLSDHQIVSENHIGPDINSKSLESYRFTQGAVTNNFFDGTGYQGDHMCCIASLCTNLDVANNLIYVKPTSKRNPNFAGLNVTSCAKCDVWNNLVYSSSVSAANGICGLYMYEFDDNNRLYHNTFAFVGDLSNDGSGTAIVLAKQTGVGNFNTVFQNNLAYKNANADGNIQWCIPFANQCSGENVQYSAFWGGVSTSENVMAYRASGTGSDVLSTLAAYNPPTTGHTYANNVQVDPVLTGGSVPTGQNGSFQPNSTYFALSATSPASVTNTAHPVLGDNTHGFRHDQGKFSLDIIGTTRTGWSMGAYEQGTVSGIAPSIGTQPTGQNIQVGQQISLSVTASGTPPLAYQWKLGSSAVSGATASTYVLANAQTSDSGSYTVVITNLYGTVTSSAATVNVTNAAVAIIGLSTTNINFNVVATNTVNQIVVTVVNVGTGTLSGAPSASAPFSITAPATYAIAAGGSQNVFIAYTPTAAQQDTGTISFTGGGGTNLTATGIAVAIQNVTNMLAGGATLVSGAAASFSLTSGSLIQAINTSGQVPGYGGTAYFGFSLPNPVTNSFLEGNTEMTNECCNSFWVGLDQFPTDPYMIWNTTNLTGAGLSLVPVSWIGNGNFNLPQFPTNQWSLGPGFHYVVVAGREANVRLNKLLLLQQSVAYPVPPNIVVQPVSQTVLSGTPVLFSVQATGTMPLSYQWLYNGTNIPAANQTSFAITYPLPTNNGSYACLVTNIAGSAISFAANLVVTNATPSNIRIHFHGKGH